MNAPGVCTDCGNEAYIRLAGEGETMICAHCFAVRHPAERDKAASAKAPAPIGARRSGATREAVPAKRPAAE